MAALVDTNVIVYRFDPRFPEKQKRATALLRDGISNDTLFLPHQALVEFVAAVTRPRKDGEPLLAPRDAWRETEELLQQFDILYPTADIIRTAIRGAAAYGLSWFDAHMWAYADHYGLDTLYSEEFEDGRVYGTVRIVDPFQEQSDAPRSGDSDGS